MAILAARDEDGEHTADIVYFRCMCLVQIQNCTRIISALFGFYSCLLAAVFGSGEATIVLNKTK